MIRFSTMAEFWAKAERIDPAELDALRKDAERYRAIRDGKCGDWGLCEWVEVGDEWGYFRDARAPHIVDTAIDAAMLANTLYTAPSAG